MNFYFAGGAMEVGGSCIYLKTGEYGILFDSGIRQGAGSKDLLPDFRGIQIRGSVDAILVSHAHMDHTGSLPLISKAYPGARIYMTGMTLDLTKVLLRDSLKLMERREEEIPAYSETDVTAMLNRVIPVHFQSEIEILPDIRLCMYPAGHIAGAACLYLKTPEGSVFYSGDVSGFSQQTIEGIGIPALRPDVMLLESTYGDRLHASRTLEEERLVRIIGECTEKGNKILIPAFALGRSQEILMILRRAIQNGQIMHVPVYVDGMIRDMNQVYTMNPTYLKRNLARRILKGDEPFYSDDIQAVSPAARREDLVAKDGSAIFVASSGMLMGGPSMTYAKELLGREDACVILTGYQDEESPGRMLLNLLSEKEEDRRVTLDGVTIPVKCRVEMVGLSAHADSSELAGIVEKMSCRRIILEHGSQEAICALGHSLSTDPRRRIYQPLCGEDLEICFHKREQQSARLFYSLQRDTFDPLKDPVHFWNYCRQNYPDRAFTAEEAAYIWYGKKDISGEDLEIFINAILSGGFFSRHPKRLYLLRANTEAEIEEERKKKEPREQDVEKILRTLSEEYPVKRIGFYKESRQAVMIFDFPDAVEKNRIEEWSRTLEQETGWTVTLKESMNHQAAMVLLRSLFGERIRKTSYFQERMLYQVILFKSSEEDTESCRVFKKETGWDLQLLPEDIPGPVETDSLTEKIASSGLHTSEKTKDKAPDNDWFLPESGAECAEQNLAFHLIDLNFEESGIRPYKKGRKNDREGGFIELFFLTPEIGRRCTDILQQTADQIGWRLHISENLNQNEVLQLAGLLSIKYGLSLTKNPAWLPMQHVVRLPLSPGIEIPEKMKEEFMEKTGLKMT